MNPIDFYDIFNNEDNKLKNILKNTNVESNNNIKYKKKKEIDLYEDIYDDNTKIDYKYLRIAKQDPISFESFNNITKKVFKFDDIWNPYTGERVGKKDPYGSLYINPINLIHYWYIHRVDNLYMYPQDTNDGTWEGIPLNGVGAGDDFYITGRGNFPEWYLFRLPILDCYIPKNNTSSQAITMGPKLTYDEIKIIYNLANKYWKKTYNIRFNKKMPDLMKLYKHYNVAIDRFPLGTSETEHNNYEKNKEALYILLDL